jgi:hypothetical protein
MISIHWVFLCLLLIMHAILRDLPVYIAILGKPLPLLKQPFQPLLQPAALLRLSDLGQFNRGFIVADQLI